ncbi:hypothetical protein [Nonomuraea basaltis]|uniref:hypothetical protein n=1 Tax=Nonomuraea basaltis TaxID=2495887 RepID=UPI00110C4C27|nr:hypothetical protein [Nonomuraea basaltis]TMR88385.1 hypothetical protein EJK15_66570 [Nonomuraea basaltis]
MRRLQYHDRSAPGWTTIGRLLRPLEVVNAGLDGPVTKHRRRAMLDVVALLLLRCAEEGRAFWGWSEDEWVHLLGRDQADFHRNAPAWAGDEVPAPTWRRTPTCWARLPASIASAASNASPWPGRSSGVTG